MNNIQQVSDSYMCSNCGACFAVCGNAAIEYKYSSIGRMYAQVNDKCVNCGLCMKVCPSLDYYYLNTLPADKFVGDYKAVFVGKSLNSEYYRNAQSGGICTTVLAYLFEVGAIDSAIVCKMEYGSLPKVKSYLITSIEELTDSQKSFYTPVPVLKALKEAKDKKSIAIVGLPCQIEGAVTLSKTLKVFSNIKYKIGLVCDRTICNGIQSVMASFFGGGEKMKIDWRRKDCYINGKYYSYINAPVVIYNNIGKHKVLSKDCRIALKEMFTAPRCRVCYDKLNVHADIVVGDPHGMSAIDNNHGNCLIIVRTDIGKKLIELLKDIGKIVLKDAEINEVLKGQGINARKKNVAIFSSAINSLSKKMDSYLYKQYRDNEITASNLSYAKNTLNNFIQSENQSQEEITRKGRVLVFKTLIINSLPYRMLSKIKLWCKL
jgi:coenzyme F420 hydrogenase subunit beta